MKKSLGLLFFSVSVLVCSACSEAGVKHPVIGSWKLISWSTEIPIDLNSDGIFSTNLLDETSCKANEILTFDKERLVISNNTFNPDITVSLKDGASDKYSIKETCAEGSIGFATEYTQINDQSVRFNNTVAGVYGSKLTIVYKNTVKVYNKALTEVVATRDVTLVYEKE